MLNQQTLEKLHALRLEGMAEAFRAQSDAAQQEGDSRAELRGALCLAGRSTVELETVSRSEAPASAS